MCPSPPSLVIDDTMYHVSLTHLLATCCVSFVVSSLVLCVLEVQSFHCISLFLSLSSHLTERTCLVRRHMPSDPSCPRALTMVPHSPSSDDAASLSPP